MVQTINPAVSGDVGSSWRRAIAWFAIGALVGASTCFFVVFVTALALDRLGLGRALVSALVLATSLAVLRELGIKVPVPYRKCQVPITWRQEMSLGRFSFAYGLTLGLGFWTLFVTSAHLGVLAGVVADPRWTVSFLASVGFATGKTIPSLASAGATSHEAVLLRLRPRDRDSFRRILLRKAVGVAAVGMVLIGGAARSPFS